MILRITNNDKKFQFHILTFFISNYNFCLVLISSLNLDKQPDRSHHCDRDRCRIMNSSIDHFRWFFGSNFEQLLQRWRYFLLKLNNNLKKMNRQGPKKYYKLFNTIEILQTRFSKQTRIIKGSLACFWVAVPADLFYKASDLLRFESSLLLICWFATGGSQLKLRTNYTFILGKFQNCNFKIE